MRAEPIVDIQKPRFGVHEICFGDNLLLNSPETYAITSKQFFRLT